MKRYDRDKASDAERFVVDRWYNSFDNDGQIPGLEDERSADETGLRIFSRIELWKRTRPWYEHPGFKVACSIILISSLLIFIQLRQYSNKTNTAPIVYQTLTGQTKKIMLKDSTSIWLNAGTRLEILPDYAKGKREVKLEGEAYFEVRHDPQQPFRVQTGELTTNVLGTSFTIQAYKKSRFARVTLLTGKVWVKLNQTAPGKSAGTMLLPDQSLLYDDVTQLTFKTTVASSAASHAWIDGNMVFESTPMAEAAEEISRVFGLHISISGTQLNNSRLYGQFSRNDRPEKIIQMISKMIDADYTILGNEITIRPKGHKNTSK